MRNSIIFLFIAFLIISTSIFVIYFWSLHDQQVVGEYSFSLANFIMNLITDFAVVIAVFFFGAIMGIVSHMGLDLLDDVIDDKRKLTIWQRRALGFFLAVFFSAVYVWVFHQVLSIPGTWLRSLATGTYFGWQPWSGEFDRSPIWWSVYNFITFFVGYLILYQWISKAVDHFNLSRGVGNPG